MHHWFSAGMKRDTHGPVPLIAREQLTVLERGEYA